MDTPKTHSSSHSADVRIHLLVNGSALPVAQLGPEFLVLRDPIDHPPCDAEITMAIDGNESGWTVHLVNGIQVGERKTVISRCADINGSTVG
jgi:hypothetical protein